MAEEAHLAKKRDLEEQEIEKLVQRKSPLQAKKYIRSLLQNSTQSSELRLKAAEWFRRLGLYSDALKVLENLWPANFDIQTPKIRHRELLRARLLNQMGASHFAIRLVKTLPTLSREEKRIVGDIYLANYLHEEALPLLEDSFAPDDLSYSARMARINLADAYAGVGQLKKAISIAEYVSSESREPILVGISNQVIGEYLARDQKYEQAIENLKKSESFFKDQISSVDFGIYYKWLGYSLVKTGAALEGKEYLRQAEDIFQQPQLRREMLLDLMALSHELGLLDDKQKDRLVCFPDLNLFLKKQISNEPVIKKRFSFGTPAAKKVIFLSSKEKRIDGRWSLGLSLEETLLGFLLIAGPWGLNANSLKGVFWPDALYEFTSLDDRIRQMLQRVKKQFGVSIKMEKGLITAEKTDVVRVVVDNNTHPSFLRESETFTRKDLAGYYSFSAPQAKLVLRQWAELLWIKKVGQGRTSSYRRLW